jgi:hypothetical protein
MDTVTVVLKGTVAVVVVQILLRHRQKMRK